MILALDQGTTGSTAIVFDAEGRAAGRAYSEFGQHFPRPGWVEHDAERDLGGDPPGGAGGARRGRGRRPRAGGHRHHQPARDRGGLGPRQRRAAAPRAGVAGPPHRRPLRRAARGRPRAAGARAHRPGARPLLLGHEDRVADPRGRGGPGARARFGTIDSWLVFKLTGRHATDYSNASRTLLFDTGELAWDAELCELLGVPPDSLPEACPSAHVYGETDAFGGSVPVAGIAGDQQAALYGQACHTPGLGKNTYGTGSFVLQNAGGERPDAAGGPAHHGRLGGRRPRGLRARGGGLRDRRRRAVAARRPRGDREGGRHGGAGALAGLQRRRLPRARLHRAGLAALGSLRARHDRGPHPRVGRGAPRARDARGDRLPDGRRGARDGGGRRAWCSRSSRPTAARCTTRG